MNEKLDWIFFLTIISSMLLGVLITFEINTRVWQMEAVRNGHAIWATRDSGSVYFKWKEASK